MGQIYICITIDWEGERLDDVNDLIKIRNKIDENIPFTHFICPNYFLVNPDTKNTSDLIKTAIKPIDEVGLHIHCYKELINHVPDVSFRTEQNYHNTPGWFEEKIIKKIYPSYQRNVTGRGVPLSVYSRDEIQKIISESKKLLCDHLNLESIKGFRAGGWIANDTVLDVVEDLGFKYDSSAVSPSILSQGFSKDNHGNKLDDYGDKNGIFTEHIINLWGYTQQDNGFLKNDNILRFHNQEAIQIHSQAFKYNNLLEIPNNCGLTDFCSPQKTVLPLIKHYQKIIEENPDESFLIVYGCHQEGDVHYKNQLVEFFSELNKLDTSIIKFIRMEDVQKVNQ